MRWHRAVVSDVGAAAVLVRCFGFHADDAGGAVFVGNLECRYACEVRVVLDSLGPDEGGVGKVVGMQERLWRWGSWGCKGLVGTCRVGPDRYGLLCFDDVNACCFGGPEEPLLEGHGGRLR